MTDSRPCALPKVFCWTRFGTEAGEPIDQILQRKEIERRQNDGVFFWGIGNSLAPSVAELVRRSKNPEVLFSPIKGRPRSVDVAPPQVLAWTVGEAVGGELFNLPPAVQVKSRGSNGESRTVAHYALVCASSRPLELTDLGRLSFQALRNLLSGSVLGASQVTAVVKRLRGAHDDAGTEYTVALRASLVAPYFIRLREPVPVMQ